VTDTDDFIDSFDSGTLLLEVDGAPVSPVDVRDETDFNIAVGKNGVFGTNPGSIARRSRADTGARRTARRGPHSIHVRAGGPLFGLDVTY
jgi:hypothetical protein